MHVHILGICGTFMGGVAQIARALGHGVSGSDANIYPPMSDQLESQGITLCQGYTPEALNPRPDIVIVGNVISRGNPALEYVLNEGIPYTSGPEWLATHVLRTKTVLAVAGTHGKTTVSSMLAFVLDALEHNPGFLIGGVPENFGISARYTQSPLFVIEADEYDTAFFDKQAKFVHYRPNIAVLNNLEFDHADIYPDLKAIQKQFHILLRTVPEKGSVIYAESDPALQEVLAQGCWSKTISVGVEQGDWHAKLLAEDGSAFKVYYQSKCIGEVRWPLIGRHNVHNALSVLAAVSCVVPDVSAAVEKLSGFRNVKRRMEYKGCFGGVHIHEDFAHHPTAIATTLQGLRSHVGSSRIIALLDLASNSMRRGIYQNTLPLALQNADQVLLLHPPIELKWDMNEMVLHIPVPAVLYPTPDALIKAACAAANAGDHIILMSNRSFEGVRELLPTALEQKS